MTLVTDMNKIQTELKQTFLERTDAIQAMMLAVLSKNNIFLLGPPGVAKSALAREFSSRFTGAQYFEALVTRTTPSEALLGPLDMPQFRDKGSYVRRTKGFIPTADLAFVDEIGNLSGVLGHSMLALLNERILHEVDDASGRSVHPVPLHTCFTAGNNIPDSEESAALWDRILIRVAVDNVKSEKNFFALFNRSEPKTRTTVSWKELKTAIDEEIPQIVLPQSVLELISQLKQKMSKATPNPIVLSDRRWQGAERLLKASAWLRGSDTVASIDIKVMQHMVWTDEDQIAQTLRFVLGVSDKVTEMCKIKSDELRELSKGIHERAGKKSDDRAQHAVGCNKKIKSIEVEIRKLWADNKGHTEVQKIWDQWLTVYHDVYKVLMDMPEGGTPRTL